MALSFDATYYMSARPDVLNAYIAAGAESGTGMNWAQFAEQHYNDFGWKEGYNPNAIFNTNEYLTANIDVLNAGVNPFQHYLQFGAYEKRAPSDSFISFEDFDWETYLAANSDLTDAGIDTAEAAYGHFVVFGQFESRPGAPVVDTGIPGITKELTPGIDNFTGTANNDTFIGGDGAVNTFGPADQLDGGAGNDTLKLYGGDASTGKIPTIKNIENVYLNGTKGSLNISNQADVKTLELDNVGQETGGTADIFTLAATQDLKLSNQTLAVEVNGSAAGGITLNNVANGPAAVGVDVDTTNSSVNLATTGKASNITLTNGVRSTLNTVNVTGDQALTLTSSLALTTINASANTGGVNYNNNGAVANLTFTGGTGNDRANVGATITSADKLDGGEGTDTLAITGTGYAKAAVANVKNFEILETIDDTTQDASVFAGNNTLTGVVVGQSAAAGAYTTSVTNIAATAKDNIVVNDGSQDLTLTLSVKDFVVGGTSDEATVTLNATTGAGVVSTLNFANVDVLNLVSNSRDTANTNTITALNATDLEKLVVTGNTALSIGAGTSVGITEVDASGLVVASTAAATGLTFTQAVGSTQSLLVTGSAGADTITLAASAKKATVVTNGGSDTVDFTVGAEAAVAGDISVKLSAADYVANNTVILTGARDAKAVADFSSDIEALLKSGGHILGAATANVVIGTALNADNNVAFNAGVLQFDLNGDGAYNAADDFAISLTGVATVTYNAAGDYFTFA